MESKDRLYYRIKNEIEHANIMAQRVEREKSMGMPLFIYNGYSASAGYSVGVAKNCIKTLQQYKDPKINEICDELLTQLHYARFYNIDRLLFRLRMIIFGH